MIQRFEFSTAAHLADELLHLGEQVHAPGSDVEANKQPLFAEAAHLAFALAEQLADLRKIEDRITFELAPVILHEVYDLEDLFDRPQDAGQVIRVLIFHLCRVWFPRQKWDNPGTRLSVFESIICFFKSETRASLVPSSPSDSRSETARTCRYRQKSSFWDWESPHNLPIRQLFFRFGFYCKVRQVHHLKAHAIQRKYDERHCFRHHRQSQNALRYQLDTHGLD